MAIVQLLQQSPGVLIVASAVLGLLVGSFLNVVVYRFPIMLQRDWKQQCCEYLEIEDPKPAEESDPLAWETFTLAKPDSHCPNCGHKIKPWENIPVISYLALGGKCSGCKTRISLRYPSVEFTNGILSGLVAATFGPTWLSLALLLFTWGLVALALIDFDHQLLPDDITYPMLWLGLAVNAFDLGMGVSIYDAVLGAVFGYLSLWVFYWAFKLLTGKEGMGYGDFKLLAALGAWMGWQSLLPIIILSSLVGAIFGIVSIMIMGRDRSAPMPFGPFLAGAGFIMLIWGQQISAMYFSSFVS
ncbi:MAG: prepilin peptidase [Pseudomonadales bacterium]|nr:prepilin peptidase [Pseudomonadales bacterium]